MVKLILTFVYIQCLDKTLCLLKNQIFPVVLTNIQQTNIWVAVLSLYTALHLLLLTKIWRIYAWGPLQPILIVL